MAFYIFSIYAYEVSSDLGRSLANPLSRNCLLRRVDEGLARCRMGVVILTKNFFYAGFQAKEFDGLMSPDRARRLIFVRHGVEVKEVAGHSARLAVVEAITLDEGIPRAAARIVAALRGNDEK